MNFRYWDINDERIIAIAKTCKKLRHVEFELNHQMKDNGIVNGIFAYCSHLEFLRLYKCRLVTGSFLITLPSTLKSLSFVGILFIWYVIT